MAIMGLQRKEQGKSNKKGFKIPVVSKEDMEFIFGMTIIQITPWALHKKKLKKMATINMLL